MFLHQPWRIANLAKTLLGPLVLGVLQSLAPPSFSMRIPVAKRLLDLGFVLKLMFLTLIEVSLEHYCPQQVLLVVLVGRELA